VGRGTQGQGSASFFEKKEAKKLHPLSIFDPERGEAKQQQPRAPPIQFPPKPNG
jgi:hypothetical protein